jgi:hypothetical protein
MPAGSTVGDTRRVPEKRCSANGSFAMRIERVSRLAVECPHARSAKTAAHPSSLA